LDKAGLKDAKLQSIAGQGSTNELLISLDVKETSEQALDAGKNTIIAALEPSPDQTRKDLNNASAQTIAEFLLTQDPLRAGTDANQRYQAVAQQIVTIRDKQLGGAIASFDQLKDVPAPAVQALQQAFFLSDFGVRNVEIVGPQVGKQLQAQARRAVLYSLAGMLIYLWFRFELIYGVAAVVAVFHDTLITLGAFSLTDKEISLTVVAAILTLVGYSMNDTIVVFDRIRENVKLLRRESLAEIVNKSINQTLSRTILTSGLTFLTVLSLYLFGGEVLHGFSFALVIGIIIGTYSSIAVAAPMLVAYQEWRIKRKGQPVQVATLPATRGREKARAR
jgi:preprotein translocase subunit SecF